MQPDNLPTIVPDLGKRLRTERRRLGLTQEDFALAAGINRTSMGFYERGASLPNIDCLTAWSKIGVDLAFVLFGTRTGQQTPDIETLDINILEKCFSHIDELENELGQRLPTKLRATTLRTMLCAYLGATKNSPQTEEMKSWTAKN